MAFFLTLFVSILKDQKILIVQVVLDTKERKFNKVKSMLKCFIIGNNFVVC